MPGALRREPFTSTQRRRLAEAVLRWADQAPDPDRPLLVIEGADLFTPLALADTVASGAGNHGWSRVEGLFTIPAAEYGPQRVIEAFERSAGFR